MAQTDETGVKSFQAAGAIPQYARVKLDSTGLVSLAVLADRDVGTALNETFAANDQVAVKLLSAPGSVKMIANAAVARGARVFSKAAGKVGATAIGAMEIGVAVIAAGADGDIIEVIRQPIVAV